MISEVLLLAAIYVKPTIPKIKVFLTRANCEIHLFTESIDVKAGFSFILSNNKL